MKKQKVTVGCFVALNNRPDAAFFEVVAIDGFRLTIREPGCAEQVTDIDLVKQVRSKAAEERFQR